MKSTTSLSMTSSSSSKSPQQRDICVVVLLGLTHMLMFVGYDTASFITEPALHAVHKREPERMDAHTGYYGQAIEAVFYMLGNLLSPLSIKLARSTRVMAVSSIFFALYSASFLALNRVVFYSASALQGFMYAMFNAGLNHYLTEISTRKTLERNSAYEWAIVSISTFIGGCIYMATTFFSTPDGAYEPSTNYRDYTDFQIRILYGSFASLAATSTFLFVCLPRGSVDGSIAASHASSDADACRVADVPRLMRDMASTLVDPRVLLLTPQFLYAGMCISLGQSIFPTATQFTATLTESTPYLAAFYAAAIASGSIFAGFVIDPLSRRIPNFGLRPLAFITVIIQTCVSTLLLLSMPEWSTSTPTDKASLLIEPSIPLVLCLAGALGTLEVCVITTRTVACALARPSRRAHVYAAGRFHQALASFILFFISPLLSTYDCLFIIQATCFIGVFLFVRVARSIERGEAEAAPPDATKSKLQELA